MHIVNIWIKNTNEEQFILETDTTKNLKYLFDNHDIPAFFFKFSKFCL